MAGIYAAYPCSLLVLYEDGRAGRRDFEEQPVDDDDDDDGLFMNGVHQLISMTQSAK